MLRITIAQNLPAQAATALDVKYTYIGGAPADNWRVAQLAAAINTCVVTVNDPVDQAGAIIDLVNRPNVKTRTLVAHYPIAPITREFQITSVQN